MPLPTAPIRNIIEAIANHYALPAWTGVPASVWLEAQVLQESSGDARARRYEPHLDRVEDGDAPGVDSGEFEDDASWGLMQVLGWNIRAQLGMAKGTRMSFEFVLDAPMGLLFGVRHLVRECFPIHPGDVPRALAVYNGGPRGAELGVGGLLRRQDYVNLVQGRIKRVLAEAITDSNKGWS